MEKECNWKEVSKITHYVLMLAGILNLAIWNVPILTIIPSVKGVQQNRLKKFSIVSWGILYLSSGACLLAH